MAEKWAENFIDNEIPVSLFSILVERALAHAHMYIYHSFIDKTRNPGKKTEFVLSRLIVLIITCYAQNITRLLPPIRQNSQLETMLLQ